MTDSNRAKIKQLTDEGKTPSEIAIILGLTPNNVRVALCQVRKSMMTNAIVTTKAVVKAIKPKKAKAVVKPIISEPVVVKPVEVSDDLNTYIPPDEPNYISRKLFGKMKDVNFIESLYDNRYSGENPRFPLLIGETGSGKNMLIRKFCHKKRLPYMRIELTGQTTPDELLGQLVPQETEGIAWVDGWLTKFAKYGGVLVLDEVNMANSDILSALHSIMDKERRLTLTLHNGEVIYAHQDFWVIGTMNPENYDGTKPLNQAFADRFKTINLQYSDDVEKHMGLPEKFLELVSKLRVRPEITTPIGTRTLANYRDDLKHFGLDASNYMFLNRFNPSERVVVEEVMHLMESGEPEIIAEDDGNGNTDNF